LSVVIPAALYADTIGFGPQVQSPQVKKSPCKVMLKLTAFGKSRPVKGFLNFINPKRSEILKAIKSGFRRNHDLTEWSEKPLFGEDGKGDAQSIMLSYLKAIYKARRIRGKGHELGKEQNEALKWIINNTRKGLWDSNPEVVKINYDGKEPSELTVKDGLKKVFQEHEEQLYQFINDRDAVVAGIVPITVVGGTKWGLKQLTVIVIFGAFLSILPQISSPWSDDYGPILKKKAYVVKKWGIDVLHMVVPDGSIDNTRNETVRDSRNHWRVLQEMYNPVEVETYGRVVSAGDYLMRAFDHLDHAKNDEAIKNNLLIVKAVTATYGEVFKIPEGRDVRTIYYSIVKSYDPEFKILTKPSDLGVSAKEHEYLLSR